ncbi:MAG: hypothetical protein OXG04_13150, partial [Acidobacteria bacterium]|nr:hypothetical protein [Acidobacteriota bacterium]
MRTDWRTIPLLLACLTAIVAGGRAQEPDTAEDGWPGGMETSIARELDDEEDNGWSNATEL